MAAVAVGVIAMGLGMGVAIAAPGQCTVGDYGTFDCDVDTDGGGVTFALPDGQVFAFAATGPGEGLGYLIATDSQPGQRPDELGAFMPDASVDGCWLGQRKVKQFCVMIER